MKYITIKEYEEKEKNKIKLEKDEEVLMSHDEFVKGGKNIKGVPLAITPYGSEPVFNEEHKMKDKIEVVYDENGK